MCVKACRKLDSWWQSQGTSGGLGGRVWSASEGRGGTGLVGGRRSGLWKPVALARCWRKESWSFSARWLVHRAGGDDKSVCGQVAGLLGADNARESRCPEGQPPSGVSGSGCSWLARRQVRRRSGPEMPATAIWRRHRLEGTSVCALRVDGSARRAATVGRVRAPSLRVDDPAGSRDKKSVADAGKRHHLLVAEGASCAGSGLE